MNSKNITYNVLANRIFLIALIVSILAIIISFGVDFSGISSCNLCKVQRIPYFVIIFFSLFGIFFNSKTICMFFLVAMSALSITISSYHIGIQQGLFIDPCVIDHPENVDALKKMLFETSVPCSKVTWSIAGIPMSVCNLAVSLIFL